MPRRRTFRLRFRFCLLLLVLTAYAPGQKVIGQGPAGSWKPYSPEQVDGTVIISANPAGPIPATCPFPSGKDHYLIGMSQANRAEPWREVMDREIAEAAQRFSQLTVIFAVARQDNLPQVVNVHTFSTLAD